MKWAKISPTSCIELALVQGLSMQRGDAPLTPHGSGKKIRKVGKVVPHKVRGPRRREPCSTRGAVF